MMGIEQVREDFRQRDIDLEIIEFDQSSATVELASSALGVEPGMIAKTMAFAVGAQSILIVLAGSVRIDNRKFREHFGVKAKMVDRHLLKQITGHTAGGICPFGLTRDIPVYLDRSLRSYEIVYPAAGSENSAVRVPVELLPGLVAGSWVDVSKQNQENVT
jgi:prolyl-tRNA editing enzyme YbaK/EbsC (Cys-tRNA(Pro) deacylase)